MRLLTRVVVALVGVYAVAMGLVAAAMLQPPDTFGRIMAKLPAPVVFTVMPFERLWRITRAGTLRAGEPAPDFSLQTFDHQRRVRLSDHQGKPVVLVFGSYS